MVKRVLKFVVVLYAVLFLSSCPGFSEEKKTAPLGEEELPIGLQWRKMRREIKHPPGGPADLNGDGKVDGTENKKYWKRIRKIGDGSGRDTFRE